MTRTPENIAIVGSGFLGMTLALRLAAQGDNVTIFEAANEVGGLASSWKIGEVTWDRHYHVTLLSDTNTQKIVNELGLGSEFRWVETKTGFYTDGHLFSMSDTMEFLAFPPLGLISKLRLGATIFYASRIRNWKSLEKIPVEKWLTRLSGKKTFEKIWRPLLKAKLGDAYRETSAAFIWSTIQRMYAARKTGLKKEMFGYVRGGYARVLERFGEVLADKGVEIRLNASIENIERLENGRFRVTTAAKRRRNDAKLRILPQRTKYASFQAAAVVAPGFSGAFLSEPDMKPQKVAAVRTLDPEPTFDKVILTCPSGIAAKIVPQLDRREKADLENVRYQGIVCMSAVLKRSLSRFYVTNITDEAPFTGVIEMSALVDKREFDGNALVYLPKYVAPDDALFERSDAEIEEMFLNGLKKMFPLFRRDDVIATRISRVRQVFPLPVLNYSRDLSSPTTSLDGLYVINSSHIVNGTLNVNETVAVAEKFFETELAKDKS